MIDVEQNVPGYLLGCPGKLGSMVSKWVISYNLCLNRVYIGVTTHLLTFY